MCKHNTSDCTTKGKIEKPKCANCGGEHVASFPECEAYKNALGKGNRNRKNFKVEGNDISRGQFNIVNNTPATTRAGNYKTYRDATCGIKGSMNSSNEHNQNTGFAEIIKELVGNIDISRTINIIKDTVLKIKNAKDSLTKVAIVIEGITQLFC